MSDFRRRRARRMPGEFPVRRSARARFAAGGWRLLVSGPLSAVRGLRSAVCGLQSAVGTASLVAAALVLAACGETPEADTPSTEPSAEATAETATIAAMSPWVRVAIMPEGSDEPDAPPVNSAAYLVLANPTGEGDALVAVETGVSDTAEIHSVTMDEGVMRMRPVDSIPVPAGGEAVLEQGGYHIMLIGLRGPLTEGDTVNLRLRLRSGRVLDVSAPVLRSPPM